MLIYFALGDAKVWHWGSKPTPGPNANGFASQWNIGLRALQIIRNCYLLHAFDMYSSKQITQKIIIIMLYLLTEHLMKQNMSLRIKACLDHSGLGVLF